MTVFEPSPSGRELERFLNFIGPKSVFFPVFLMCLVLVVLAMACNVISGGFAFWAYPLMDCCVDSSQDVCASSSGCAICHRPCCGCPHK